MRALGVLCDDDDLHAVACISDLAENERDEEVLSAAINVLVSMGKSAAVEDIRDKVREREHKELKFVRNEHMHPICDGMKAALPLCARDRAQSRWSR